MRLRWLSGMLVLLGLPLIVPACVNSEPPSHDRMTGMELRLNAVNDGVSSQAFQRLMSLEGVTGLVVSIENRVGDMVYNSEQVRLYNFDGTYLSQPLSLLPGSYALTRLLAVDDSGTVLYATPAEGSPLAHLVTDPLPISFEVSRDTVTTVHPQVLSTAEYTPEDFGYASFSVEAVEVVDFLVAVFAYDEVQQEFALTDAHIAVSKESGTVLYTGSLSPRTNRVTVPQGHPQYRVLITKPGYKPYSREFTGPELASYFDSAAEGPLEVVLEKLVYHASCSAIRDAGASNGDGVYTIDPDGVGAGEPAFDAYCDMTTDGGGWTLCARLLPDVQVNFASKVWGGSSDGTVSFGINCQRLVALGGRAVEYRVTTVHHALPALIKTVTASTFDSNIDFEVGLAADPLTAFYQMNFCGGDGGCARYMQPDGQFVKRRYHSCGGTGCSNNQVLFFGTDRQPINDHFGSRPTNYNGVWHYLYQHGACYYDGSRACWGSLTEDFDSHFRLEGKHTYHWIR